MSFDGMLQNTGSLYYPVSTQDASGGTVLTYTARVTGIPCAVFGVDGAEQVRFASSGIVVTHKIYSLSSAARTGDKFVDSSGRSFVLHSIREQPGMGSIDTFYKWIGEELLPGV